jgi:hypothetical protein
MPGSVPLCLETFSLQRLYDFTGDGKRWNFSFLRRAIGQAKTMTLNCRLCILHVKERIAADSASASSGDLDFTHNRTGTTGAATSKVLASDDSSALEPLKCHPKAVIIRHRRPVLLFSKVCIYSAVHNRRKMGTNEIGSDLKGADLKGLLLDLVDAQEASGYRATNVLPNMPEGFL